VRAGILQGERQGLYWPVKMLILQGASVLLLGSLAATSHAGGSSKASQEKEVAVFVTGSLIPQRVKVRPIGTKTTSPVRVISRTEMDQNGRPTTPGAFVNDPSVRIIGH
jgi:hypothetical protein